MTRQMVARRNEQPHRGAALTTELHDVTRRIRSPPRLVDAAPEVQAGYDSSEKLLRDEIVRLTMNAARWLLELPAEPPTPGIVRACTLALLGMGLEVVVPERYPQIYPDAHNAADPLSARDKKPRKPFDRGGLYELVPTSGGSSTASAA